MTYFADKALLRKLNKIAEQHNYNRQIVPEAIDRLPDDAIIAVQPMLVHEHAQGKPVEPHARCMLRVCSDKTNRFTGVMLDVPFDVLEFLPTLDTVKPQPPSAAKPKDEKEV